MLAGFRTAVKRFGKWYNAPPDDPESCCALARAATEFGCQGLELDLPILCWGTDFTWTEARTWQPKPKKRRNPVDDPNGLLLNAYRVLLTRGRDGFVVFLPPVPELDSTEFALLAAGVRPLPEPVTLPLRTVSGGAA